MLIDFYNQWSSLKWVPCILPESIYKENADERQRAENNGHPAQLHNTSGSPEL